MSKLKKTRISFFPYFEMEASLSTFFDKDHYEVVSLDLSEKGLTEKYGQEVYGDWCCPLKLMVAACEKAIYEDDVEKIIGVNINVCSYPLVMGNMQQWIKKKFEYYPIQIDGGMFPFGFITNTYQQLKKAYPDFNHIDCVSLIPHARQRYKMAASITHEYLKKLPLSSNPAAIRREFLIFKKAFLNVSCIEESQKLYDAFLEKLNKSQKREKAEYRFLLGGDITVMMVDFPVIDLEVFLAKHGIELMRTYDSYNLLKYTKHARKARDVMSDTFSCKNNRTKVHENHSVETSILFRLLKGMDEKVDGIIYVKPNMCAPCDNLSYVLKKNGYFDIPTVEISYDEHSGANGIETRLEAFMNIVAERRAACV